MSAMRPSALSSIGKLSLADAAVDVCGFDGMGRIETEAVVVEFVDVGAVRRCAVPLGVGSGVGADVPADVGFEADVS